MMRIGFMLLVLWAFPWDARAASADPWLEAMELEPTEILEDFTFIGGIVQHGEVLLDFQGRDRGRVRVAICNRGGCPSFLDAGAFTLYFKGHETTPALEALMRELGARLEKSSPPPLPQEAPLPGLENPENLPPMLPLQSPLPGVNDSQWFFIERSELLVATLFLLFALAFSGRLGRRIARDVAHLDARARWVFVLLLALAAAVRLFAPYKLVMAYTGYRLIENAWELLYWKYGAGGALLYHVFLRTFGPEVDTYILLNRLLGLGSVALASLWFARYTRFKWAAPAAAFFVGLTPILALDHVTESNLVPAIFFLFGGLYFWERRPQEKAGFADNAAGLAFMLAAVTIRPLFVVLIPLVWVALALGRPDGRLVPLDRHPGKLLGLLILAGFPLLLHVFWLAGQLAYSERFETWAGLAGVAGTFREFIGSRSLLYNPAMVPALLSLMALFAPFALGRRKLSVWLGPALVSLIFFAAYMVDLPAESLTRLQAPSLTFTALAAATLVAAIAEKYAFFLPKQTLLMLGVVGGLFGLQSLGTIENLWEIDNQSHEEAALRRVAETLPADRPVTLVAMRGDAPRPESVPIEYPLIRFRPPNRQVNLLSIDEFTRRHAEGEPPEEAYFYLGMRCYAFAARKPPTSPRDYMHPACAQLLNRFQAEPLWSEDVPNVGTPDGYIGYPSREYLQLALYRIERPLKKTGNDRVEQQ